METKRQPGFLECNGSVDESVDAHFAASTRYLPIADVVRSSMSRETSHSARRPSGLYLLPGGRGRPSASTARPASSGCPLPGGL